MNFYININLKTELTNNNQIYLTIHEANICLNVAVAMQQDKLIKKLSKYYLINFRTKILKCKLYFENKNSSIKGQNGLWYLCSRLTTSSTQTEQQYLLLSTIEPEIFRHALMVNRTLCLSDIIESR